MNQLITRWIPIVLASILMVACGGNSPSGVVKSFYKNVENGELTKAMEALPAEMLVIGEPKIRKGLEGVTEEISKRGGIQSIETKDDCKGEVCTVMTKIIYKNGKEDNERVKMTKVEGKWKMSPKGIF